MPIRIFVGCAANHEDVESQAVLEWSIRKHTSEDVEITWMKLSKDPDSFFYSNHETKQGWNTSRWATPFSGFRWSIPAQCGYEGKAIYMDSDFIVKADIAEAINQEFKPGAVVMSKGNQHKWRFCFSIWDCAAAERWLWPLHKLMAVPDSFSQMHQVFKKNEALRQDFQGNWNCLDGEKYTDLNDPAIKAIHYTSMPHQPQLKHALPRLAASGGQHWFEGEVKPHWRKDLQDLFDNLLAEATQNGYGVDRYMSDSKFGPYVKKSTGNRSSAVPSWGK